MFDKKKKHDGNVAILPIYIAVCLIVIYFYNINKINIINVKI